MQIVKKLELKNLFVFLILFLIVFTGFNLRRYKYAQVPRPGDCADEYSFGWLGISLLKDKYPIAWSGNEPYKHNYQKINVDNLFTEDPEREPFPLDKPWFDHPPFFGLVVGGFAYLSGVRSFENASVLILRRPMIVLGTLNIILIFTLVSLISGKLLGLISSAIYSFTPLIAISSRLALAENGYIPIFLSVLIFTILYIKKKNIKYWYLACFLSGIAVLFKLSAIAIPISVFLIVYLEKEKLDSKLVYPLFLSVFIALTIFFFYGVYFDFSIFLKVFLMNVGRTLGAGSEIFYQAIVSPRIVTLRNLVDGWNLLGWISFFIIALSEWKKTFLSRIFFLASLRIFLSFGFRRRTIWLV